MNAVLHYIYDPLCGWCYGAEPLVWAASKVDGLALQLHAGGLWPQPTRLPIEIQPDFACSKTASASSRPTKVLAIGMKSIGSAKLCGTGRKIVLVPGNGAREPGTQIDARAIAERRQLGD